MEFLRLSILALTFAAGNLHYSAILDALAYLGNHAALGSRTGNDSLIHAVGDGTDGRHRRDDDVLHRTDIEVGIGTHHRRVAAGADIVAHHHRMREGLAAVTVVHEHINLGILSICGIDRTDASSG